MCYSVESWADARAYVARYQAGMAIEEFEALARRSARTGDLLLPRQAEDSLLAAGDDPALAQTQALIRDTRAQRLGRLEQQAHELEERLAAAESRLATRPSKSAENDRRVATNKLAANRQAHELLLQAPVAGDYTRVFPGGYAPVLCVEEGQRKVMPMRYQCRPTGKPAGDDDRFPGTYNARLDTLLKPNGYWKTLFGRWHGIVVIRAFHENVALHDFEQRHLAAGERPRNLKLRFTPYPPTNMIVPCVWSRWQEEGEAELLSFAVITHDPPPEVAVTGHDRCPLHLREENIDAWLHPEGRTREALTAILLDKPATIYRHEGQSRDGTTMA